MKVIALVTLLSVVACSSAALPVVGCGGSTKMNLTVTSVRILTSPECEAYPCVVKEGTNVTIMISFKNNMGDTIQKLNNSVFGVVVVKIPYLKFPPADVHVCSLASDASSKCPIEKGDEFTEKLSLPVIANVPAITVTAIWELVNEDNGNIEGCFEAQLKLVK